MQQRGAVGALGRDGGPPRIGVDGEVEALGRGGGEARGGAVVPLHGGARSRPVVVRAEHAALGVGQAGDVAHADLVAVVDRRERGPGELEGERRGELFGGARTAVEAREVVVGGGQRDVPGVADGRAGHPPRIDERIGGAPAARVEERVDRIPCLGVGARAVVPQGAQRPAVGGAAELEEEVGVEPGGDGHRRIAPLRQEHRLRMGGVQPAAQLGPHRCRGAAVRVVLDQRVRHVDPESGEAQPQPVVHDVAQCGAVGARPVGVGPLPPRLGRIEAGVAEVEGGLGVEEVRQIRAGAGPRRPYETVRAAVGRPDVAVVVRVVGGRGEPRMPVGGVTGDQVEEDPDAAPPCLVHELGQVVVGAVAGSDGEVVRHVVPGVAERRGEAGIDPDGVDPEPGQVVEMLGDAVEVTDPVAVGVREGLRIDLVEDGVGEPGGCGAEGSHGRGAAFPS